MIDCCTLAVKQEQNNSRDTICKVETVRCCESREWKGRLQSFSVLLDEESRVLTKSSRRGSTGRQERDCEPSWDYAEVSLNPRKSIVNFPELVQYFANHRLLDYLLGMSNKLPWVICLV